MQKLCGGLLALILALTSSWVFAGSFDDKTNNSHRLGVIAVKNTQDPFSNPGFFGSMEKRWHFSGGAQILPEKGYWVKFTDPSTDTKHETTKGSVIPSAEFGYRFKDTGLSVWALFTNDIGGGAVDWRNGTRITYNVSVLQSATATSLIPGTFYAVKSHSIEAEQVGPSVRAGLSYSWNDFVFSAGARFIDAALKIKARNALVDRLGVGPPLENTIEYDAKASGLGGVFGVQWKLGNVTLAATYFTAVELDYKFDVDEDTAGVLPQLGIKDGDKKRDDASPQIKLGVWWDALPWLGLGLDYTEFFNQQAKKGGATLREGLDKEVGRSYEVGLGFRLRPFDKWSLTGGYMYSKMGVPSKFISSLNPDLNADTCSLGITYQPTELFELELSSAYTKYRSDKVVDDTLDIAALGPYRERTPVEFGKTVWSIALGGKIHF
jgi:hypothetical protein